MTELLVIGAAEVKRLLPMTDCIELMEQTLRELATGTAAQPLRTVVHTALGALYTMPGYVASPAALAVKLVSHFPANRAAGLHTHQGVIVLFDSGNGEPVALIDAAAVTAIRTAAVSAAATRALARADAATLAIIGSGVQAGTHLEAMAAVRPIRRARVWSPTRERLERFVAEAAPRFAFPVDAAASARAAVEGADIVCTVTSSAEPVVRGEWVRDGVHVNAVGASSARTRELDTGLVAGSRFFVDRRESANAESGDLLIPRGEGAIGEDHIAGEIGEVFAGLAGGRGSPGESTVFKSLGLAVEDAAAAAHIVERARRAPDARRIRLDSPTEPT